MRIRQKYYPYPVMERVGRSYKEFLFNVTTSVKREGYNIVFEFNAEIADEQISKLIKEGKAVFAYSNTDFCCVLVKSEQFSIIG